MMIIVLLRSDLAHHSHVLNKLTPNTCIDFSGNCQTVVHGTPPTLLQDGTPFFSPNVLSFSLSLLCSQCLNWLASLSHFQASFDENSHFIIAMLRSVYLPLHK